MPKKAKKKLSAEPVIENNSVVYLPVAIPLESRVMAIEKLVAELKVEINSYIDVAKALNVWKVSADLKETGILIGSLRDQVSALNNNFNEFKEKFIEEFTDAELKDLFDESGLTIEEVKMRFNISAGTASNLVNGTVSDLVMRSDFGRFCRYAKKLN